jgi:hypothetical protein
VVHEFGAVANADCEDGFDVGCVGSAEDFVTVVVIEVEMGVGIDEVHRLCTRVQGRMAA